MTVTVFRPCGAAPVPHRVRICDQGAPCHPRATALSASILRLFGAVPTSPQVCVEPPWPESPEETALAEVVLLVAHALSLPFHGPDLAVALADQGARVVPLPFDGPDDLLLSVAGDRLTAYDARPGVGVESVAERLRTRAQALQSSVIVEGVETVEHVLCVAFGDDWTSMACEGPEADKSATDALFEVALYPERNPLSWRTTAALAIHRLFALGDRGDAQITWKLGFARDVARRHTGESVMPPWPDEETWESFSPDERLAVAAHLVQGAADAMHEIVPTAVAMAEEWLERDGREAPVRAAELWGAVGRAEASTGRLGGAVTALMRACRAWRALGREDKMSYAASELLRVSALATVDARAAAQECKAHAGTDVVSRAFVQFDEARAEVLLGRFTDALRLLDPSAEGWPAWHHQLVCASLRWRHRALLGLGRDEDAATTLCELEAHDGTEQTCLALLDKALVRDGDWRAPLRDLFASVPMGSEALRTWRMLGGGDAQETWTIERARRLADWYRY